MWTDGSSTGGVIYDGVGALIVYTDEDQHELRTAAGSLCSSLRAEMIVLFTALDHLLNQLCDLTDPFVICTDSR